MKFFGERLREEKMKGVSDILNIIPCQLLISVIIPVVPKRVESVKEKSKDLSGPNTV